MEEISQENNRNRRCITRCYRSDEGTGRAHATGEQDGCPGNLQIVSGKSHVGGGF